MTDEERIDQIKQARTREELDQAMSGYLDQVMATHLKLRTHYAFNLALKRNEYFQALCDLNTSTGLPSSYYDEVMRLLEITVKKQHDLQSG